MCRVSELDSCTLSCNYGKTGIMDGIMEIMGNTVHVHTFLSFVLISGANYEEKKLYFQ